ncbi:MAG: hypothetical protein MN733_14205 [Nitrososphaera sp.]|nr:hypothetical protein [Nitrososphaera sp.]
MMNFLFGTAQRSLITAVVMLLVTGGIAAKLYFTGRADGSAAKGREMVEAREKERAADRETFSSRLLEEQVKANAAERRYLEAVQLVSRLNTSLTQAKEETAFVRRGVGRLSDNQLFADIRARLGMVPPTDTAPFTAPELREIDIRVSEHPLLVKQNDILRQTVEAEEAKLAAKLEELRAVQEQRDAAITAYDQLTGHYLVAYNATRKGNLFVRIVSLGFAGRAKKLSLPAPVTLPKL